MVELTNPIHITYVTTPELTNSHYSLLPNVWRGRPVVVDIINDSNRQVVFKQGDLLTHANELDEILPTDTESQHTFVNSRHYGVDDDRDLPSWEEGNKMHNEMAPPMAASFIPYDSLDDRCISAKRKEV